MITGTSPRRVADTARRLAVILVIAALAACDTAAPAPTPLAPPATATALPAAAPSPTGLPATETPVPTAAPPSATAVALPAGATAAALPPSATPEPLVSIQVDVTVPADTPLTDTIYISGDFQSSVPRAVALSRQDGHATGTVTAGAGRIFTFRFTRGSLATVEAAADCTAATDHNAVVAAGATITATVAAWADRCVVVYDARAAKVTLASRALGIAKDFYVYTPPGYAGAPGRRYPVLYLLRGHEREWINPREDGSRAGHNVLDVYEGLLAAGQVGPIILVFPGISSTDDTVPGMLTNFRAPELAGVAGIGSGRFEDYFVQELIPYVDSHYRTIPLRDARGVDGFSLGGFMSMKIAAQHPDLFSTAGAFDGLYFWADATCRGIDTNRETLLDLTMFWPVFGNPADLAYVAANNPPNLVCRSPAATVQSIRWFVQYGPESAEPNNANYYRGVQLLQALQAKGVQDGLAPILSGGHRWATADAHMRLTLPLHWAVFASAISR